MEKEERKGKKRRERRWTEVEEEEGNKPAEIQLRMVSLVTRFVYHTLPFLGAMLFPDIPHYPYLISF